MRSILRGAFGLMLAAAVVPSVSHAQKTTPVHFGVLAGLTLPLGDYGDAADAGYHLGALADFKFSGSPIGLRIDGQWHRNGLKDIDGNGDILFGAASLTAESNNPTSSVSPYVLGGVGIYHVKATVKVNDVDVSDSENKAGFNVGAGLKFKLSGFNTFLEARYHYISTEGGSTSFLPISFGIIF